MGLEAAHLAGGEVGDDDDVAADELFGGVPLGDAGEDLALFVAEVDLEAEELVGLGDALGDDDLGDAEIDFGEVVDGDLSVSCGVSWSVREDAGGWGFGVGRGAGALGGDGAAAADGGSGVFFGEGGGARGGSGVGGVVGRGRGVGGLLVERAWMGWACGLRSVPCRS